MRYVVVGAFAIVVAALASPAQADIVGRASVIDGDTLEIHGQRVRLFGIDAPESAQTCIADGGHWRCGQQAAKALDRKVASSPVTCEEKDRDKYGRIVAVCRLDGKDLNAWLVAEGWALAYRQFSTTYVGEEHSARGARKGLWRGEFAPPWEWRMAEASPPEPAAPQRRDCRIKGNINDRGEHIYHVPGGQFYDRTGIAPSRGEGWFCTEAEARAAGWRRSLR